MEKTNVTSKITDLFPILDTHFKGKINRSRLKLMSMFVIALCKVQTVGFEKLSKAFDSEALPSSSLRRIQRFIADFILDADLIAKMIFSLLPEKENLSLCIDRTNWKLGQADINILMLGITYQGVAFPLLFKMLNKRGNSNTRERIELIDRFIRLFGDQCIDCLTADREFIGDTWIKYLNDRKIRYYIRIKNNFLVQLPNKKDKIKVSWLFESCGVDEFRHHPNIVKIGTQDCYISGCKPKSKGNCPDFLIIISFNKPEQAQIKYAERWQLETCFKSLKSSGFNLEETHLTDINRIEKLLLLVTIAFIWCYKIGIFLHENIRSISIKTHGRKEQSIFKYGLSYVAGVLLNSKNQSCINIFEFLSCT